MATLSPEAKAKIRESGATVAGYVRHYSGPDGIWYGDKCGCIDDRCIGFHHDSAWDCGCLAILLDDYLAAVEAELDRLEQADAEIASR
jgi:hypothetical protein